tara:strand:- start:9385 stop:10002 length:618 start_codon:yes stop_codon:yes gene_type:complete
LREIAIIDYGAGNLRSVQKAFEQIGQQAFIASDKSGIEKSAALVFPGQGSLPSALQGLEERKLIYPILDWIKSGNPFLGVCLGLQFLLDHSEEGNCAGLGVVPGSVKRFNQVGKVPHMGWNSVELIGAHPIFKNVDTSNQFYFVHSYYAEVTDKKWLKGTTRYGVEFCSVLAHENVIATQFHPEKSGAIGLKLYENFAESMVHQK